MAALDPQCRMLLDVIAQQGLPELHEMGVEAARTVRDKQRLPPGPDAVVRDHRMEGPSGNVAIREYRPIGATGTLGGLVYFHGGGFVLGSLDSHDALCRQLAVDSGCAVLSVDYRLAPEHKFPSAVDDAYAATCWAFENAGKLGIDSARIAVGGDSAGGALATAAAITAKQKGGPKIAFQLLLYPVTDMRSFDTVSHAENAEGYFLTRASMVWFRDHYFVSSDHRSNPLGSPLASEDLSGLPPALVITAGFDPLRDEAEAYAGKLQAAGVPCKLTRYDGAIHAFMSMYAYLECGRAAVREAAEALRKAVGV
jgi:acetyl esterase